jgi:aspartokinase-like uncharacterized kinase
LVVGGGRFADVLRDLDRSLTLGEERSHALALRVLDLTARLLGEILPGSFVIEDLPKLEDAWSRQQAPILVPRRFMDDDDRSPDPLPHAWTTTTDAIAARLAVRIKADELVLLKSAEIPEGLKIADAARLGLVDPEFPRAVVSVPVVTIQSLIARENHSS